MKTWPKTMMSDFTTNFDVEDEETTSTVIRDVDQNVGPNPTLDNTPVDENVAKDDDVTDSTTKFDVEDEETTSTVMGDVDQNVPANSQLAVGYRNYVQCPMATSEEVRQQRYCFDDDGDSGLNGLNLYGHIDDAVGEKLKAIENLMQRLKEADKRCDELELERDRMLAKIAHHDAERDEMSAIIETMSAITIRDEIQTTIDQENTQMAALIEAISAI